jgi:D-lactate dehydratase / protein deglycase
MIATDERYLPLKNGRFFSTGNHPVEMLLPMSHLAAAGYDFDIATLSGNMAKLELWGLPPEDMAVKAAHKKYLPKLDAPMRLADVVESNLGPNPQYAAVFIPGGHGATVGIPHSSTVKDVLDWALANEIFIITLCHGPAALLAATDANGGSPFKGCRVCVFPDSLDRGPNREIGYLPGEMKWLVADELKAHGIEVINDDMTGQVHQDRRLLTGDNPLASNALGQLAVKALRNAHPS